MLSVAQLLRSRLIDTMAVMTIGEHQISSTSPVYFVADISANHDGELDRAKKLIRLAAEAGADAAKFQHFRAPHIVSERGFSCLGTQISHQAKWHKSVYQVYESASLPWEWTPVLRAECDAAGIDFFSAAYDLEAVDMLESFVPAYKIGSGDITWPEMLEHVARKGKPVLLACGASDLDEVQRAVEIVLSLNPQLCLMQCNTNYTGNADNFQHIHLNVLSTFRNLYPEIVLGLSDHTPGHSTVLGAVALGARVIEKHFTDDTSREGPDHPFSMTPSAWREMVMRTRELEAALGSPVKQVAGNEQETRVIQRRCIRAAYDIAGGTILTRNDLEMLRPAPLDAIFPYEMDRIIGKRLRGTVQAGDALRWTMLDET